MADAVAGFQQLLAKARHICVLTGAGISAESGIPTFRGAGGLWRTYEATRLATPGARAPVAGVPSSPSVPHNRPAPATGLLTLATVLPRAVTAPAEAFKRNPGLVWEFYHVSPR